MSEVEKTVDYKLRASSEGLENITRFTNELDKAGIEATELKDKAAEVSRQLQTVTQQQGAIDTLRELGEQSRNLGNRLADSTAQVERLGTALPEAVQSARQLAQAETSAADAVRQTQTDIDAMQQALVGLRTGHEQAARGSDEYKASVSQARVAINELRQQLASQKEELSQSAAASKAAATEQAALQREYDAAVSSASKASAAVGDNRRAMDTARESAKALGVDSSKLAEEQKRVDVAAREARAGLETAAAMCDRLRDRQAAAAQAAKSFQEDLKKLAADGPQAPAGLEAAFRKLGMGGVREAETAVHELQIALAQIKASGDILPADKAAAVAAFKQRVAELKTEAGGAAGATQQLGTSVEGSGNKMAQAAHKAVAWTTALVGLQQLKSIAESVVDTGSKFENLEVRLRNLLGGTEAAQTAFTMLKNLAASTPFEVAGLTESYIKLTAFGLKPTEDQMRSLVNVASNLGGGTETLSGVTLALGQAWAKGKLQGEEIMQLAERGVPIWDALAKATGRTVPELQRMSEAGILGRDVISKLIDELGRMNDGASEALMRTYAGAVANAKDALAEFFDMIAKSGVLDWLTEKIRGLLAEFDRMKQTGELQAKAKEIADAFLNIANMAETVTRGLIAMAPVIEKAVAVWLAFKAVGIAQTLYSIAGGGAAAATGVAAAGTAAAVAGGQMAGAAASAGALATSLRILRSLTGVGIALGVAELAQEFFRAKRAAEESDVAVRKMLETAPASNQPKKAVDDLNKALGDTSFKATDALAAFDRLIEQGEKTSEVLSKIGKDFDLSTIPGIRDAAVVLDGLLQQGKITAQQFRDEWAKQLKDIDLSDFELRARAALEKTWEGVGRLEQVIDAGLREAIRRAGGDFDVISGGMGKAAKSAINDVNMIVENLERLKTSGADVSQALSMSLSKAISTVDSQAAIDTLRERIESLRTVLGDRITDGLLDQLGEKVEKLNLEFEKTIPGVNNLREALTILGVKSEESLQKLAKTSKEAFDVLTSSGAASARELTEGFKKAAEDAIAANKGIAPVWVVAQAALRGYEIEVDKAGKSTLKLKDATNGASNATDKATGSINAQTTALERLNAEREREIAAQEKANQLKERELELYREKWNIDKDGFTKDSSGNRQTMTFHTAASVYNQARDAGLDEKDALALVDKYNFDNGNSPNPSDVNRDVNDAIVAAARKKVSQEGSSQGSTSGGSSGSTSGGSTGGGTSSGGDTHVNQITIYADGGVSRGTTTHTTSESAQTEVRLLKTLADAKGVY